MSIFEQFEKTHYSGSIDTSNSIVISNDGKIFVSKKLKKIITKSTNTYKIYYDGGYLTYDEMVSMQNYLSVVCYALNFVLLMEDGKLLHIIKSTHQSSDYFTEYIQRLTAFQDEFKGDGVQYISAGSTYFVACIANTLYIFTDKIRPVSLVRVLTNIHSYYCTPTYLLYISYENMVTNSSAIDTNSIFDIISPTPTLKLNIVSTTLDTDFVRYWHANTSSHFTKDMLSYIPIETILNIFVDFNGYVLISTTNTPKIYATDFDEDDEYFFSIIDKIESISDIVKISMHYGTYICIYSNGRVSLFGSNEEYCCFVDANDIETSVEHSLKINEPSDSNITECFQQSSNIKNHNSNSSILLDNEGKLHCLGKKSYFKMLLSINDLGLNISKLNTAARIAITNENEIIVFRVDDDSLVVGNLNIHFDMYDMRATLYIRTIEKGSYI